MGAMSPSADEREAGFAARAWVHSAGVLSLERPRVMGIVNLTPDSFHDGGRLYEGERLDVAAAVRRSEALRREGADILDLGGESTRPGAQPVDPRVELERVLPVLRGLAGLDVAVSVDTRHAGVAREAIAAGAAIVNDVSGLADPDMARVVADSEAGLVIGHMRGDPATMQREVRFVDLLREITDELAEAVERAVSAGIERPRIVVDPGIGFGKTAEQSAALVAASNWLRQATRCPVMIGASRKSFLSAIVGGGPHDRLPGSLAAALVAVERGASVLRVHDVVATVHALAVARSIRAAYDAAEAQAQARGGGGLH